jgi:hypothetical protein
MSKLTFFLLAAISFALTTLVVGIRGVGDWEAYEFVLVYFLLVSALWGTYRHRVRPATE